MDVESRRDLQLLEALEQEATITQRTLDARRQTEAGIRTIDGLTVLGEPAAQILAMAATDPALDVFAVSDVLAARGWHHDRQSPPDTLHATVSAGNAPVMDEYLADLRAAVEEVRGSRAEDRSTSDAALE